MNLTEFLTAMIDGDERIARQGNPHGPEWDDADWKAQGVAEVLWDAQPHGRRCGWRMGEMQAACTCGYPARVLAECEAKRRILEHHRYGMGRRVVWPGVSEDAYEVCGACYERSDDGDASNAKAPCLTLRLLALPYADHPDYDEAWRV